MMDLKDKLYTLRWNAKQIQERGDLRVQDYAEAQIGILNDLIGDSRETPYPSEDLNDFVLVVIVGHEKKAPGADFAKGGNEYEYNSDIAKRMKSYCEAVYPSMHLVIVYRDGIGISGAYKEASKYNPDACIELHFNAFNESASGTETLSTPNREDVEYSGKIQKVMCKVFGREGLSRGVKVIPRNARGAGNIYSLPGFANCLVEPFFGDNVKEAELADRLREAYARALVDETYSHLSSFSSRVSS